MMSKKFVYMLTLSKRFYLRLLCWSAIVMIAIGFLNVPVWKNFNLASTFALIFPYLAVLWYWLMSADMYRRLPQYRMLIVLLGILFFALSHYGAYLYFYHLLPKFGVAFFSKPIDGYEHRFLTRSATANFFFILIATLDYHFRDSGLLKIKLKRIEKQLAERADSAALSLHFIRNLVRIVSANRLADKRRIYAFFDYLFVSLHEYRTRVSLVEEWANLESLMYICDHRNYRVTGKELLDVHDWNLSVPALCLLTWMENAIQYSPQGPDYLISLDWQVKNGYVSLSITNSLAAAQPRKELSGRGLALVERLSNSKDYMIHYQFESTTEFTITFTIK